MLSAGGMGGWLIASYATSLAGLVRTPFGWPLDLTVPLDYRVLIFCSVLSVLTSLVFGLIPALRATRLDLVSGLKPDAPGNVLAHRFGLRSVLVIAQVAICTVLLLCTGLFLRSLHTVRGMDFGVRNRNLLLLAFDPSLGHRTDAQSRELVSEVLERARSASGVEAATLTTEVPLTFIINNSRFKPAEKENDPSALRVATDIYTVGPGFFSTMGISILAGGTAEIESVLGSRAAELDKQRVGPRPVRPVIVNDAFARAAFPNESPIGRRIVGDGKALDIVGVVQTVKSRTIGEDPRPSIYLPILTEYIASQAYRGVTLVVKTRGAAGAYADSLRQVIRSVDPSLAVFEVRTMESHVRDALVVPRLTWGLSAVAGGIGLTLATIGVYGVISFAVARRRRELGIRLAIGARPGEVLTMILETGPHAGVDRHRGGPSRCARRHAFRGDLAVRRESKRPRYLRRRPRCAARGRASCLLAPGAGRLAARSRGSASQRVGDALTASRGPIPSRGRLRSTSPASSSIWAGSPRGAQSIPSAAARFKASWVSPC